MDNLTRKSITVDCRYDKHSFVEIGGWHHHTHKYEGSDVRHLPWKKFVFSLCHFEKDGSRFLAQQMAI